MKENIVQEKSYAFALRIVALYRHLAERGNEFVLSKQVLRSGTSIGANLAESVGAQSRADFASKLAISYKESCETRYWLMLLRDSGYLSSVQADSLLKDCEELLRLIGTIQLSLKRSLRDIP